MQKINLHQLGKEYEPKATNIQTGSADICFITKHSIYQVLDELKSKNIITQGPFIRTGAIGNIISIYLNDPDGNLIEIANYINH